MRVSLVHNKTAGGGATSRQDLKALLKDFGYDVQHHVGKKDDWNALIEEPGDMVVVAGGDGTVGAVARKLIHRGVPIAVLPLGTANNIARTLGIQGTAQAVVAGWATAQRRSIDLGVATGPWGKSWFVESLGLGLLAAAMARLHLQDKQSSIKRGNPQFKLFRDRMALAALATDYPPLVLSGSLDGQNVSGELLLMEAMNIPSIGPGLELASRADPADGLLDFVFVPAERRAHLVEYLVALREGDQRPPPVCVRSGRHLRVAGNGYDAHLDDRMHGPSAGPDDAHLDIEVRIDAQAVQLLVPGVTGISQAEPLTPSAGRVAPIEAAVDS